ncbi:MAG: hypothetical protein D6797_07630 [Bdellovibrio sp.]|nr:MAG: hypothetical protein D6797_07630 [Bdellovibrio sp.]
MKKWLFVFCCVFQLSCSLNALRDIADKNTDEALLEAAKQSLNEKDWTGAIAKFSQMSSAFLAREEVKHYQASAYAGRCGYDFFTFIDQLSNMGSENFFLFLMKTFKGTTSSQINDCIQAESILKSIDTNAAKRSIDDNIMMAMMSLVKIGAILAANFDTNADGVVDSTGSNEACSTTYMSDSDAGEVGTGITLFLTSLGAVGSSIGGVDTSTIDSLCTNLDDPSLPAGMNFCSITDKSSFTPEMIKGIRSMVNEGDTTGLATCSIASPQDIVTCYCP